MKIVCVGDCGIDHYLPSGIQRVGGITANFARHALSEFPVEDEIHVVTCVGSDAGAELVLGALAATDFNSHVEALPGTTPMQYIELEPDGEKRFVRYDEGVLGDFEFNSEQRETIASSTLLVAPVYSQIIDLYSYLLAIETEGQVAIDFADFLQHPDFALLENYLDSIDIGFFGLTCDDTETMERIASLAARHQKLFVVTLGAQGSRAFHGADRFECAAMPVKNVVDTTGAGDAFAAAFLSRYCHGAGIQLSLQRGAELAASVVARIGGHGQESL